MASPVSSPLASLRPARLAVFCLLALALSAPAAFGQSQALNGQIEGTVADANGASVPAASITVTNVETGAERNVSSDESGVYRVPLLPLGSYRIAVEAPSFKKTVREGVTLSAGQTVTVAFVLEAGSIDELVTITSDAPVADPGKIDVGRVMPATEVKNLPLVSRNPYNFALLQANVTGRPNVEFGVPRINANGYARRTNYQLDGNNNTQADRAGIRLMPISEVFVSEVQLVTNGFSAEFGNTPGLIMNAITPSGTNEYHGHVGFRFRRTPFSSRPFNFNPTQPKPGTKVNDFTASAGGPIIKDRWQFYAGYEHVLRDLAGEPQRVVTISQANQQALIAAGVPAEAFPGTIPTSQLVDFFIVRTDAQLNDSNRLVGRYNLFRNTSPDNIAGGATTLQRSIDFIDESDSVGLQLVSTVTPEVLNEFRYQYARRFSQNVPNENSATGLTIVISGVANFGAPENANTIQPLETSNQFLDNLTVTRGAHTMKFGGGVNFIADTQRSGIFSRYTFPSIAAYNAARTGADPLSYTNYTETVGDPEISYDSRFYHFFAQDDWKVTRRLKVNYGLRYDLYDIPEADPGAPLEFSRDFRVDKNNFAPRLGLVYALREGALPTVLRASAGLYYDFPLTDLYRRALLNNGNVRFTNFSVAPRLPGGAPNPNAPRFPDTLGGLPPGTTLAAQTVEAVAPDFDSMYAFHLNGQVEQALSNDMSVTVGFIQSLGRHIPVYRNINPINPVRLLADGRPVFSSAVNASTRRFPQFNNVLMAESVGNSSYTAGTLSLNRRLSRGYQFSVNYTLSHAIDDAPEQNLVATQFTNLVLSDPTDRRRDRGNSLADQRHTFVASFVGRPAFDIENGLLRRLANDNQVGFIVTANSGEAFNIVSTRDLNLDNFGAGSSDRPLFVGRNTGRTPSQFNVDMRYTRYIRFSERFNAEVFGEFINLFNVNSVFQVNGVVATDANGVLEAPLPDFRTRNPVSLDSRQFQLGFKFNF
jgi:hypothetical protein